MFNPMLLQQMAPIKQALQMVRSASNPQQMMQQLMQANPSYSKVQQLIQQNGGDAKTAFYSLAKQYGIDPEEVLSFLK